MTIDGKTICNLIQSFPVLLILAQNNNKCLKTPFIYKPPSPTHPPGYYEAYDALIQNLFGHDCYYNKKHIVHHNKNTCHNYEDHTYGHETPVYGHVSPTYGYPYGYPSYGYGHEYQGGSYPSVLYSEGHLGYSRNGLIGNGSIDNKSTYAPKQVYNVKRRVKIVVKNKGEKIKRSQKLTTGFFPNERRQRQPLFGFQNFPNTQRSRQQLSSLLHLQRETPNSNQDYIYPFNNRPNANNYPFENPYDRRPNNNFRFPNQNTEIPYDYVNFENDRVTQNPFKYNQVNPSTIETDKQNNVANPSPDPTGNEGHSHGLSFEDFITNTNSNKPSFGDTSSNDDNINKDISKEQYVHTDSHFNSETERNTMESNVEINSTPESVTSSGLIMVTVSNEPLSSNASASNDVAIDTYKEVKPEGGLIEATSGNPSFGDRNGEIDVPSSTRATLTPVPPTQLRDNLDFAAFRETCTTVDGAVGTCIRIQACQPFLKLLQNPRDKTVINVLRRSQCGFEGENPKVCCPLPGIPDQPPTLPPPTTSSPTPSQPETPPEELAGKSGISSDLVAITALPEPPVCGISNASFSRVVNGIPAKLGDFPWMALLGYKGRRGNPTRWLCGGALVTSHHVLTAAHCIHNREDDLYVVRLGELDLAREDDGATPLDVLIRRKIKHEGYDSTAFTNDIGLLVLDKDVEFTGLITPICIPQDEKLRAQTFEKYNPLIAGWGDVAYRGPSASHLQVAQLPVVTAAQCQQAYSKYKAQVIDERVLCAGHKDGRQDACQGDSGGPLMQPIWNAQTYKTFFFQIGVVSYGKKCAEPGFPGVYTRVTHFVPWLQDNIRAS